MMGQQEKTESLFYYFRLEDQIPEDHLLRLIDRHGQAAQYGAFELRDRRVSLYGEYGKPFNIIFERAKTREWRARRDSNSQPFGPKPNALSN